jgi:hypothetical protein
MAKEIKEKDAEEKQEPVKPAKKAGDGSMSIVTIVGVIGGTVVLMFILLVVFFIFFIKPMLPSTHAKEGAKTEQAAEEHKEPKMAEGEMSEAYLIKNKEFIQFAATDKIITNPKGSSTQFVVLRLGVEYIKFDKEGKPEPPAAGEAKGVPTFEGAMKAKVEGQVLATIGSFTIDEFQAKRDSLSHLFKEKLKETLKEDQMKIKEVVVMEFIVQ